MADEPPFNSPPLEHPAVTRVHVHRDDFIRLWNACLAAGLPPNVTIGEMLNYSPNAIAQRAFNLRRAGYDVPPAPSRPPHPGNCPHCGAAPSAQRPHKRTVPDA
jgi:hypothetical protein